MKKTILAIMLIAIITLSFACGSQESNNEQNSQDGIDIFVDAFNDASEEKLIYLNEFDPQDKDSTHYRTEFRLNAYKGSIGKVYSFGDASLDVILTNPGSSNEKIRIYLYNATLKQCETIVNKASSLLDESVSAEDISGAIESISNKKSAQGYYYAKLALLCSGTESEGYELMLDERY